MVKADIHTHTMFSHAVNSVAEMYEAAKEKGLEIYGFSEHSPRPAGYSYPSDYQPKLLAAFPTYISEVQTLCRNSVSPKVLLGLEVDFIPDETEFMQKAVSSADYDYIIGGLHFQGSWGFDSSLKDWEPKSSAERYAVYAQYYEDLYKMSESGLVDIVAHPDLVKMFTLDTFNSWLELPTSVDLVRRALESIKQRDLIMEVSSAGVRKPCNEPYPGPKIMKMAAEIGLKISISSDAHATSQIAFAFDQIEDYVKSFGFREYHVVEKRQKRALGF